MKKTLKKVKQNWGIGHYILIMISIGLFTLAYLTGGEIFPKILLYVASIFFFISPIWDVLIEDEEVYR